MVSRTRGPASVTCLRVYHDLQPSVSWISGESQGYVMQPAEEGPHSHHPRLVLGNVSGRGFYKTPLRWEVRELGVAALGGNHPTLPPPPGPARPAASLGRGCTDHALFSYLCQVADLLVTVLPDYQAGFEPQTVCPQATVSFSVLIGQRQ